MRWHNRLLTRRPLLFPAVLSRACLTLRRFRLRNSHRVPGPRSSHPRNARADAGARNATERATDIWKKTLADYVPTALDPAVREAIEAYVARRSAELGAAA